MTDIFLENQRRKEKIRAMDYDPAISSPFSPHRRPYRRGLTTLNLPVSMLADPEFSESLSTIDFNKLRFRHDFEFWAITCVKITDKISKQLIPFHLNLPQRRLLEVLEEQRRADVPIRLIMLKARQWGGSTLVQIYFAWIQIIHKRNWNSLICAHVKDAAANIRSMYSTLLAEYPEAYWEEEEKPQFKAFERMTNTRAIAGRGCRVMLCSSEAQESARGADNSMAHLSEVAFWKDSAQHTPLDLIRSVVSGIALKPLSCVVMESTANGVGNFFHREWVRAASGESDKVAFFVPWYEIGIYTLPVEDPDELFERLTPYERNLWDTQPLVTLEALHWYHENARGYQEKLAMWAEYPSTAEEAFSATSCATFPAEGVERMRARDVKPPLMVGDLAGGPSGRANDLSSIRFVEQTNGLLWVWKEPDPEQDYIVSVDIGGRTATADYSVITVLQRKNDAGIPEVVATWRGHIDHDLLAWKAMALAQWYGEALLVVESNSWEASSEGHGRYILGLLRDEYRNLYLRPAAGGNEWDQRVGFHTNQRTKPVIISQLVSLVRDGGYVEPDARMLDEMTQYETLPDGSYSARRGCHDDILMSRAIALWVNTDQVAAAASTLRADIDCFYNGKYYDTLWKEEAV